MKYHLANFFGTLLAYAGVWIFVSMSGYEGEPQRLDLSQGLQIMGVLSGFVMAYMVTKNFKDKGEPI